MEANGEFLWTTSRSVTLLSSWLNCINKSRQSISWLVLFDLSLIVHLLLILQANRQKYITCIVFMTLISGRVHHHLRQYTPQAIQRLCQDGPARGKGFCQNHPNCRSKKWGRCSNDKKNLNDSFQFCQNLYIQDDDFNKTYFYYSVCCDKDVLEDSSPNNWFADFSSGKAVL